MAVEIEERSFVDEINEVTVKFYSNAPQSTIEALAFNGEWEAVRAELIKFGYTVIDSIAN